MRAFLLFIILLASLRLHAQDNPKTIIHTLNRKFQQVKDYSASLSMKFDIPGVKMKNMQGKVFFKQPNKFRIKAKGIFFLPRQNPMQQISTLLLDTSSYTSIISGEEVIDGRMCVIINIIPLKAENELILGKFWIDRLDPLVRKSQITTRNNGTLESYSKYSSTQAMPLPEKITVKVEVSKIKVPKMMSADLNKKSKPKTDPTLKETGTIDMYFSDYKVNTKLGDEVFVEKDSVGE